MIGWLPLITSSEPRDFISSFCDNENCHGDGIFYFRIVTGTGFFILGGRLLFTQPGWHHGKFYLVPYDNR